jgi:hypothetical protein
MADSDQNNSKDFVEHLRTVHFSLMAVCLGLIVIVQFPSSSRLREAIRQLDTIIDAAPKFSDNIEAAINSAREENKKYCRTKVDPLLVEIDGKAVALHLEGEASVGWRRVGTGIYAPEPADILELRQFKEMWDSSIVLSCLDSIGTVAHIEIKDKVSAIRTLDVPVMVYYPDVDRRPVLLNEKMFTRYRRSGIDPWHPDIILEAWHIEYPGEVNPYLFATIVIPTTTRPFPVNFHQFLAIKLNQPGWRDARFSDAFYELDQATADFQDTDFIHLKRILHQSEKNTKETFQAFGVTFPIETTSRWGILVIVSVQLYLWMHLREFRKRCFGITEIAWIGSYEDFVPRLVFVLTAILFPVVVVRVLCFQTALLPGQVWNLTCALGAIVVSAALAGLSAKVFFRREAAPAPASSKEKALQANV